MLHLLTFDRILMMIKNLNIDQCEHKYIFAEFLMINAEKHLRIWGSSSNIQTYENQIFFNYNYLKTFPLIGYNNNKCYSTLIILTQTMKTYFCSELYYY